MKMNNLFETDDNSTPLTEEEKHELIPKWVINRKQLNELESLGIFNAEKWLLTSRKKELLSEKFLKTLHKKMFQDIWGWAGKFRTTEKNIGVAPYTVSTELKKLFDDVNFWIENKIYSSNEIGARFHHRLVYIHPFPNGNGRISRIMADLLMKKLGQKSLNWGQNSLVEISELREKYIQALRKADEKDYSQLINFVSSKN